jgi:hypothetical protein
MRRLFATIRKCSLSNLLRGTDLPRPLSKVAIAEIRSLL